MFIFLTVSINFVAKIQYFSLCAAIFRIFLHKDAKNAVFSPQTMLIHLNPAIAEGYVRLLYPDKPRHPRQKYLLTLKGLAVFFRFNIH